MEEVYPNIFQQTIRYPGQWVIARNLLVVRQPGRSLMVDTAMNLPQDTEFVVKMLKELGISYQELDVFITHDHPDHSGLVGFFA
ncbi:MAG: MBL fold metallo-hydrolase, partial [Eubacteriales bacterium]|nr:MBL fold metallo-hydrolase [Eubacteriales bacterium]